MLEAWAASNRKAGRVQPGIMGDNFPECLRVQRGPARGMSANAEMRDVAEAGLNEAAGSGELYGRLTTAVGSR
jgi:hypothetical protein